jgi:hypothetical protein
MIKLSQTGVGTESNERSIRDSQGSGLLPVQANGDGTTTFRLMGRVSAEAPWVEIKAAGTADFLESFSWVPFIQLEVTAGATEVTVWIAEG